MRKKCFQTDSFLRVKLSLIHLKDKDKTFIMSSTCLLFLAEKKLGFYFYQSKIPTGFSHIGNFLNDDYKSGKYDITFDPI